MLPVEEPRPHPVVCSLARSLVPPPPAARKMSRPQPTAAASADLIIATLTYNTLFLARRTAVEHEHGPAARARRHCRRHRCSLPFCCARLETFERRTRGREREGREGCQRNDGDGRPALPVSLWRRYVTWILFGEENNQT